MRFAVLLLLLALSGAGMAVEPGERLSDTGLEARARAISAVLRCLVCQNESIDESHADLARDIRGLVRRRLTLGDSDDAAIQAVVARYGDFVLLRPPVRRETWLLWFGPPGFLAIALIGVGVWLRRGRKSIVTPPGLTDDEEKRLAALIGEDAA